MRLIDADAIAPKLEGTYNQSMVRYAPEIDAVPVVRCRECVHWKPTGSKAGNSFSDMEYIGGCEFTNYCRRESDFCSYGKRKEEYAMPDCKWCQDEICVNADCPMCADYCPVPDIPGVCRFEERGDGT